MLLLAAGDAATDVWLLPFFFLCDHGQVFLSLWSSFYQQLLTFQVLSLQNLFFCVVCGFLTFIHMEC